MLARNARLHSWLARFALCGLLSLGTACASQTQRRCPNPHTDLTKRLYNDIVTELIEQRLYNAYLPEEDQKVFEEHFREVDHQVATPADSVWHQTQWTRFQRKLFGDTAHFQTFYLATASNGSLQLAQLPDKFTQLPAHSRVAALITELAPSRPQAALDSLNRVQSRMYPAEFQLCTARLQPAEAARQPRHQGVGTLALSGVVFNANRSQALLSFSWHCGGRCGFGAVLLVEQVAGRWYIKRTAQTWIS